MKKYLLVPIFIILMLLVGGCKKKTVEIDVSGLAQRLKDEVGFEDQLSELDENMYEVIYEIKPEDVAEKKAYISTGATAEEVAVFLAKTDEGALNIKEAFEKRIEDQKEGFETYLPEEMVKLNDPVIVKKDRYIILCISNNNEKAKEIIG